MRFAEGAVGAAMVLVSWLGVAAAGSAASRRTLTARLRRSSDRPRRCDPVPRLVRRVVARARRRGGDARIEAGLPVALEGIARGLRSGASLRQAIGEAGTAATDDLATDLARVAIEADRGTPVVDALDAWASRRPLPGVRLAVAALALGAETGGAQARAVDGVAATLRQRLAVAAEARALATQARASAAVLVVAPIAFCALASATDPRLAAFLFATPLGWLILVAGLALDGVGAWWMSRLTRIES